MTDTEIAKTGVNDYIQWLYDVNDYIQSFCETTSRLW